MRVPAHHHRNSLRNRIEIQFRPVVQHIDPLAAQFQPLRRRKPSAVPALVDIPPHRRHWSDLPEPLENLRLAHISRMQDVLDAPQRPCRFLPEQPVCVRDDPHQRGYSPTSIRVRGSR